MDSKDQENFIIPIILLMTVLKLIKGIKEHAVTDESGPSTSQQYEPVDDLQAGYQDVKALLFDKCGLTNIILDNLVNEGKSKRVTVGVSEEGDAAILVRKINGLYINGQQLFVEDQRKKRSEQPYVCHQQLTQHREERSHDYVGLDYPSSNQGYGGRGSDQGGRSQEYLRGGEYSDRGGAGYSERPHDSKISQELLRGRETSRQNRDFSGRYSNYPPQHQEYSKREDPVRETEYARRYNEYSGRKQESSPRNRGQEYLGHEQDSSRSQNASRNLGPRNQDYPSRATDNMGGCSPRGNDYSSYRVDDHRVQKNQEYPSQHVLTNRDLARNPHAMGAAERLLQRSEDLVQMEQAQQQAIETLHYENQMMAMVPDPSYSSQDMMAPMMIAPQMVPEPMMGGYGAPVSSQMYFVGPAQGQSESTQNQTATNTGKKQQNIRPYPQNVYASIKEKRKAFKERRQARKKNNKKLRLIDKMFDEGILLENDSIVGAKLLCEYRLDKDEQNVKNPQIIKDVLRRQKRLLKLEHKKKKRFFSEIAWEHAKRELNRFNIENIKYLYHEEATEFAKSVLALTCEELEVHSLDQEIENELLFNVFSLQVHDLNHLSNQKSLACGQWEALKLYTEGKLSTAPEAWWYACLEQLVENRVPNPRILKIRLVALSREIVKGQTYDEDEWTTNKTASRSCSKANPIRVSTRSIYLTEEEAKLPYKHRKQIRLEIRGQIKAAMRRGIPRDVMHKTGPITKTTEVWIHYAKDTKMVRNRIRVARMERLKQKFPHRTYTLQEREATSLRQSTKVEDIYKATVEKQIKSNKSQVKRAKKSFRIEIWENGVDVMQKINVVQKMNLKDINHEDTKLFLKTVWNKTMKTLGIDHINAEMRKELLCEVGIDSFQLPPSLARTQWDASTLFYNKALTPRGAWWQVCVEQLSEHKTERDQAIKKRFARYVWDTVNGAPKPKTMYGYGGDQPQIQIPSLLSQPIPEMMLPVTNQVPAVKNQNDISKRASYQGVSKSRWDDLVVSQQRARRETERHEPTRASLRPQPQDNTSSRRQGNLSRDRYREDETLANIRRQDIPIKDRFREDETRANTRRQGISVRDHFREDETHSTTHRQGISVRDCFREDDNHPNTRRQSIPARDRFGDDKKQLRYDRGKNQANIFKDQQSSGRFNNAATENQPRLNAVKQVDSAYRQIRDKPKRINRKRHLSPNNDWIPLIDTRRRRSFSHDPESDYHSETRMAQAGSIAPSYVRVDVSAGNVGCSNESISFQTAGKNKLPPYKPNTIPQIMKQEKRLRKRAVIHLAVTLLKGNGYPDMVDPELFTKLKISIQNRIDVVLGENIGTEFEYMLKTYRAVFPISGDSKFLKAVIAKVQNKGKNTTGPGEAAPKPANSNETGHSGAPTKKKLKKVHVEPGNLPTCPQAKMKLQTKREFSGEQTYTLEPPLEQALEDELEELAQIFVNTCETPDKPEEAALCEKLCEPNVVEHFKQVVQLHVSKRILNIQSNLVVRIFGYPKAPNREKLQQFLQGYGVTSLKKSKGSKMYVATLSGYKNFDKLCKMDNVSISNNKVTFKAMHLAGPPPKLTRHDIDKLREKRKRKMYKWNKTILSVDKPQAIAIKPQLQTNTADNNQDKNKTGENHTEIVNIKNDVDDQFNFENGGNWDELTEAQQVTMMKEQENKLEDWAIMDTEDDMTVLDEVGEDIEDGIAKGNAAEDDPGDFPDIDVSDLKHDDLEDY